MFSRTVVRMSQIYKIPATLPQLPYAYNALEPNISGTIMELHHSKHHATYVANFNKVSPGEPYSGCATRETDREAGAASSIGNSLPPATLIELLQNLSTDLVSSRLENTADPSSFDPQPFLAQSAPLFAALHGVNRRNQLHAKECRARTQEARLEMDAAHLRLQNLLFERNHLEREIRSCQEYSSEYQNLPLHTIDELRELAALENPPAGLQVPLSAGDTEESAHELMLARLAFELAERKRFEEERKELGAVKAKLIMENEVKKARLEDLEKQLHEFVEKAKGIQAKMQEEPTTS
ncbi:hypothetical protein JCM8547_007889 [Rhodosporidiobolus lusitaniae]